MPPPMKSAIWKYFTLVNNDTAQCSICKKDYSRKGRTNTSLKNHLKCKHPEEYTCFLNCEIENQEASTKSLKEGKIPTPIEEAKKQLSLEEALRADKQYDKNNPKSVMIDKLIGEMIAVQDLPFHFVEGIGFRRLMSAIMPKYNLRGRNFFTNYVCNDLYEKVAAEVKKIIKEFKHMTFTTDIWTDPSANVSLLSLTCHGINENFERKSIILKCETFEDRHTGDIIAEKYECMLTEWGIARDQVHCIIRDEGSNMKRAMAISQFRDIDCTAHKLQLCVKNGLKSHQTQKELNAIQERLNQPKLSVFQDCITRWNSSYYMMERFLKIGDSLTIYSNSHDIPVILPEEWKIMQNCVDLLAPFEESTRELSNSNALISSVIPLIQVLTRKLDEQLNKTDNSEVVTHLITVLKTNIISKFSDINDNFLYTISTFLDPRYKTKFFSEILKENVETEILRLCNACETYSPPPPKRSRTAASIEGGEEQPSTSSACKLSLQNELEVMLCSSDEEESSSIDVSSDMNVKILLKQYSKEKRITLSENPLDWWRTRASASASADIDLKKSASASASADIVKTCISNNPGWKLTTFDTLSMFYERFIVRPYGLKVRRGVLFRRRIGYEYITVLVHVVFIGKLIRKYKAARETI
ncbi:hypothetical protein HF086_008823 [Spodoptera exigua]|uniref:BED-type domain-containing protein n=1 Tax=Spodoptera exigua TaxID=7107 RepID=A0A922SN04_SPOEX|nr:hypothetical protein HF086_008823 [Spodoptera exigua]